MGTVSVWYRVCNENGDALPLVSVWYRVCHENGDALPLRCTIPVIAFYSMVNQNVR